MPHMRHMAHVHMDTRHMSVSVPVSAPVPVPLRAVDQAWAAEGPPAWVGRAWTMIGTLAGRGSGVKSVGGGTPAPVPRAPHAVAGLAFRRRSPYA